MPTDNLETEPAQFVVLRQFRDLPDTLVVKSILDSAGIECLLGDENIVRLDWFWSNLVGGIKLWVRQQDLEQAENLIEQNRPKNSTWRELESSSSLAVQSANRSTYRLNH